MVSFLFLCIFALAAVDSTVISLPGHWQNGTELLDLSLTNATTVGGDHSSTGNATSLGTPIDRHFSAVIDNYPDVKISGKSTYMNILKAMIQLSYSEGTHEYAGETFSFPDYTNVKIRITRSASSHSVLQYRYAIWGLYKAGDYFTSSNTFTTIIMSLLWSGSGAPTLVGTIEIFPDPLPGLVSSKKVRNLIQAGQRVETAPLHSLELANFTSIEEEKADLVATTNAKFSVFAELQGETLTIPEVFMTLYTGLVHIASFGTAQAVDDFSVGDNSRQTVLLYRDYRTPRISPPFFTYHTAARALGYIPRYMFAQHRFEAVMFVVEIDGTPVGFGHLRKNRAPPLKRQRLYEAEKV